MTTNELRLRRIAAAALAIVGVIHLVLAPEYLDEQAYIGVLFIAGGLAGLFVAFRLWIAPDRFAWTLGALVAAGMFVGFVLSRTTGLPGFHEEEWELSGIISLILEAGYLGAFFAATRGVGAGQATEPVAVPFQRNSQARATAGTRREDTTGARRESLAGSR